MQPTTRVVAVSWLESKSAPKGARKFQREINGAIEGTRTPTPLRVHGPEPCASANSATMASGLSLQRRLILAVSGRPTPLFYRHRSPCQTNWAGGGLISRPTPQASIDRKVKHGNYADIRSSPHPQRCPSGQREDREKCTDQGCNIKDCELFPATASCRILPPTDL